MRPGDRQKPTFHTNLAQNSPLQRRRPLSQPRPQSPAMWERHRSAECLQIPGPGSAPSPPGGTRGPSGRLLSRKTQHRTEKPSKVDLPAPASRQDPTLRCGKAGSRGRPGRRRRLLCSGLQRQGLRHGGRAAPPAAQAQGLAVASQGRAGRLTQAGHRLNQTDRLASGEGRFPVPPGGGSRADHGRPGPQ